MSSQKDDKQSRSYWEHFAQSSSTFITANQIASYILIIALIVQSIGALIEPTDWLIWNVLTFIVATNLGAVLLAIHAQKSADDIRELYKVAFNADFYHTIHLMTTVKIAIEREAKREGISLQQEADELGMDSYSVLRGYMKSFAEHYHLSQSQIDDSEIKEAAQYDDESELFN